MPRPEWALRPGEFEYGDICPDCAGAPKTRQAKRCRWCRRDWLLEHAREFAKHGADNPAYRHGLYVGGRRPSRATGATSGRPQPDNHPWRKPFTDRGSA